MLPLDLSAEHEAIRSSAHDYLQSTFSTAQVRRLAAADGLGWGEADHWRQACSMHWPALLAAEQVGGAGLGVRELVLLSYEIGRALAPSVAVWATIAAAMVGSDCSPHAQQVAAELASGAVRGTVALTSEPDTQVDVDVDGQVWGGSVMVPYARGAEHVVVVSDAGLHLVDLRDETVDVQEMNGLDRTRPWSRLRYRGAQGRRLEIAAEPASRLVAAATLAIAADSTGAADRALELAVEYARERRQFGRPVATYQAVSHRCAQMLLELEGAWTLTWQAANGVDADPGSATLLIAMAKSYTADVGVRVPAAALQVHGGIGYTAEHAIHLYLCRGRVNATIWTSALSCRALIAEHTLAPRHD